MTRVSFYILQDTTPDQFTCRLTEKVYKSGMRLHIHTQNETMTSALDQMLWTFRDQSFVPHSTNPQQDQAPVVLSHQSEPDSQCQVLINLADQVPSFFSRCERVADIVANTPQAKQAGRERFSFYRDRGYAIDTHQL